MGTVLKARMDTYLDITRTLKVLIPGLPKDWKHPPGRPRHTWLVLSGTSLNLHDGYAPWKQSPASQPWPQLSMEIRSGLRTLEAPCGNRYAPARGMHMMMMILIRHKIYRNFQV